MFWQSWEFWAVAVAWLGVAVSWWGALRSDASKRRSLEIQERQEAREAAAERIAHVTAIAFIDPPEMAEPYIQIRNHGPSAVARVWLEPLVEPTEYFEVPEGDLAPKASRVLRMDSASWEDKIKLVDYLEQTPAPRVHWMSVDGVAGSARIEWA